MENKGFLYLVCAKGGIRFRVLQNTSLSFTATDFGSECKLILPCVHLGFMPFVGTCCHTNGHPHTYLGQQCMSDFGDEIVVIVLLFYRSCKIENELSIKLHPSVEDKLVIVIQKSNFALYICKQLHTSYCQYIYVYIHG